MSVRCPDCHAVAGYGREISHKSDCPSLRRPDDDKVTLEIRHRIGMRDDGSFFVRETFGDQPAATFEPIADRATADALVIERRDMLMKMVADISPEAADAVDDARIIDNLKAGNA
ncbi:MAG: hypothetical protein KF723_22295 [Rhizobiaceae bacterium]|nr:hypothetical protein [Rhizobiaceae bacterium]